MRHKAALPLFFVSLAIAGCGKSTGGPASPSAPIAGSSACDALGQTSPGLSILNGASCDASRSPVVRLNTRGVNAVSIGICSGTVIAPRAILTAAHCLGENVRSVRVWLGVPGEPEMATASFVAWPNFVLSVAGSYDVGLVTLPDDLPRTPVSLLTSRAALVGEAAVVAGWGENESGVSGTLRAGHTTLSDVSEQTLRLLIAPSRSSTCAGDSGGPLLVSHNGAWVIAGVASAGSSANCTEGSSFFAAVRHPNALAFILQHAPAATQK